MSTVRPQPPSRACFSEQEARNGVRIECDDLEKLRDAFDRAQAESWVADCIVDPPSRILTVRLDGELVHAARPSEWERRLRRICGSAHVVQAPPGPRR